MKQSRLDSYDRHCLDLIAEHGWMVQGVFPRADEDGAPFAYTVGLAHTGRPELVISGLPAEMSAQLLNTAAENSGTAQIRPGQVLTDVATIALRVVEAPHAETSMSRRLFGTTIPPLQLVWPDAGGAYPGEPGWSLGDAQPVFDRKDVTR